MNSTVQVDLLVRSEIPMWRSLFRWIRKVVLHWITGKSEIHRLCEAEQSKRMVLYVRHSILLSKQLSRTKQLLVGVEDIEPKHFVDTLMRAKKINVQAQCSVYNNLWHCAEEFKRVNGLYRELYKLRDTTYNSKSPEHEGMLEDLWTKLKPDVRREGGRFTSEWGEIGFQGKDPKTDFRSMGILALKQLVFLAESYPSEARRALSDSVHPQKWYPFAVTGINVTSFLIDCTKEHLLDERIFHTTDTMRAFHECYCELFMRLNDAWKLSDCKDLMGYPPVMKRVFQEYRRDLITSNF